MNVHFQRLAAIDEMEALDDVQIFGMRRPEPVHKSPVIESDGVDDERIALVVADGFAVPRCLHVFGMPVRQVNAADVIEACQYHHNFFRPLNEIERPGHWREQECGSADRPATRVWGESGRSGEDKLVALADRFSCPRLEDGIVGIAHGKGRLPPGDAEIVIGNVRVRGVLPDRSGSARRRNERSGICEPSGTRIGREIGWRCGSSRSGKTEITGQVNCAGQNASRDVSGMSGHWGLLGETVSQYRRTDYTKIGVGARAKRCVATVPFPFSPASIGSQDRRFQAPTQRPLRCRLFAREHGNSESPTLLTWLTGQLGARRRPVGLAHERSPMGAPTAFGASYCFWGLAEPNVPQSGHCHLACSPWISGQQFFHDHYRFTGFKQ